MNFMFSFQNGKSTFVLRFSAVDPVAESVAAFTLNELPPVVGQFPFLLKQLWLWLCRGTQELLPLEILRMRA